MYRHLLLYCQSSFPSALLYHQSCNYLPYNPLFSCRHHRASMLPSCSTDTAATAIVLPPLPQCWPYNPLFSCHHHRAAMLPPRSTDTATTVTVLLPPPNAGHVRRCVTTKLPPPPLPPRRRHHHHHCRRCEPATASTKLLPLRLSILQDKFDNEKNSVTMQTLIAFDFLDYSNLTSNSCMGGCSQYLMP